MALVRACIQVLVDWDNDIDFDDADEDISQYVKRVVIQRGQSANLRSGTCQLTLRNADAFFTPNDTRSPFYGNLTIGRRVQVRATVGTDVNYLFTGYIEGIVPEDIAKQQHQRESTVSTYDLLRLLELRRISTKTFIDYTTGDWVNLLLDSFAWDGAFTLDISRLDEGILGRLDESRSIDDGKTTIPYWQISDQALSEAIRDFVQAEGGIFYIRGDGVPVFEDRHHRPSDRDSLTTYTDAEIAELTQELISPENHIEVVVHPRRVGTPASVVWSGASTDSPLALARGETQDLYVAFTDPETGNSCEALDIITPAAPTDFAANSAEDGTGNDLTDDLNVTLVDSGDRYSITITNSGSKDMYVTLLQLRGTPLITDDTVTLVAEDLPSIGDYLQRDLTIDCALLSNALEAQDRADYELGNRAQPRTQVKRLRLAAGNVQEKIAREISDRITIASESRQVSEDFFIDAVTVTIDGKFGRDTFFEDIDVAWELTPVTSLFFLLDVDEIDDETVGLGY